MSDLTEEEQKHVRTALRVLRARCGGWRKVAKALHISLGAMRHIVSGGRGVSAAVAVRTARFVKMGVDDLLEGKFVPGQTCPHCGLPLPED